MSMRMTQNVDENMVDPLLTFAAETAVSSLLIWVRLSDAGAKIYIAMKENTFVWRFSTSSLMHVSHVRLQNRLTHFAFFLRWLIIM
jgi:Holliday junction resolvase